MKIVFNTPASLKATDALDTSSTDVIKYLASQDASPIFLFILQLFTDLFAKFMAGEEGFCNAESCLMISF